MVLNDALDLLPCGIDHMASFRKGDDEPNREEGKPGAGTLPTPVKKHQGDHRLTYLPKDGTTRTAWDSSTNPCYREVDGKGNEAVALTLNSPASLRTEIDLGMNGHLSIWIAFPKGEDGIKLCPVDGNALRKIFAPYAKLWDFRGYF